MEHGQHRRCAATDAGAHAQPRTERNQPGQQQQRDAGREHVERHMRGRRPPRVGGRPDGCQQRGAGGADVGADDDRRGVLDADRAAMRGGQHHRGGRARRLDQQRHQRAEADQHQRAQHAVDLRQLGLRSQRLEAGGHRIDAEKEQAEAGQRQPPAAAARLGPAQAQQHARGDHRQRVGVDVELEPEQRDQPARQRRADVGAEQHPQHLAQREHAGVDEADRRDRDRRRGLHQRGHRDAAGQRARPRAREALEHVAQRRAGALAQALGHQRHAQQQQADAAGQRGPLFGAQHGGG